MSAVLRESFSNLPTRPSGQPAKAPKDDDAAPQIVTAPPPPELNSAVKRSLESWFPLRQPLIKCRAGSGRATTKRSFNLQFRSGNKCNSFVSTSNDTFKVLRLSCQILESCLVSYSCFPGCHSRVRMGFSQELCGCPHQVWVFSALLALPCGQLCTSVITGELIALTDINIVCSPGKNTARSWSGARAGALGR